MKNTLRLFGMLVAMWLSTTSLFGQIVINEVQYHGMDLVELKNQGNSTVDVASWWLCSFPVYNQISNITTVSGSTMLGPGQHLVLSGHSMGTDDELGLYISQSFSNSTAIRDYIEWGSSPHTRSAVAVVAGVWDGGNQFIAGVPMGSSIEYDGFGDASTDYLPQTNPTFGGLNGAVDCDGGMVNSSMGLDFGICVNQMSPFVVSHTTARPAASYAYIVTDTNNMVLAYPPGDTIDLAGAGVGVCRVWGISFTGTLNNMLNVPLNTVSSDSCWDISANFITVIREVPDGGMVASTMGDTIGACVGNILIPVSHTTMASNLSYWYVITDANDNILAWTTSDTVDLSGAPAGECHIWGWSNSGLPDPIVGQNISTLDDDFCEDISSNFITVHREVPDGGMVASTMGDTIGACVGNILIPVSHTTMASNLSYWYVITDANDNILAWTTSDTVDLSGAPAGECHIWGWSNSGLPDPIAGQNISTLDDDSCEDISSNFITVIREVPDGGMVASTMGDTIGACVGNILIPVSHTTMANNLSYWYVITDANDNILAWTTSDTVDLSGAPAGECHIWGWSNSGLPDPIAGQNISTLDDDSCEDISSNFITVIREVPDGGMVASTMGDTIGACVGNILIPVSHTTMASNLSYWYVITDANDNILAWTTSDTVDLSGAPAGECHIWGWSNSGLPDPIAGQNISTLDDDSCEDISSNFITVIREVPDGGMVASTMGDTIGACVGNILIPVSHTSMASNLSYWYVITDANDNILAWTTSDTVDLSGAPAGECHIWGWSNSGLPDPIAGQNISTLDDDSCEDISSNFITVIREVPDGGTVNSNLGTVVTIVIDTIPDPINMTHMTNALNLDYAYIITDTNDIILNWTTNPVIDLNGAGAGVCRIWGWSHAGLPDPVIGDSLMTLNDDDCESISVNFIEVTRELLTGIPDLGKQIEFTVYPNPFTEQISIDLNDLERVRVFDTQGRLIYQENNENGIVQLGQLSSGMYQLIVETKDGRRATKKVVKQ